MTDAEKQKLRGRVRAMRAETADWNGAAEQWAPPRFHAETRFTPGGRILEIDQPGVDGSIHTTSYAYDDAGRLVDIGSRAGDSDGWRRVMSYDEHGRLARLTFVGTGGDERLGEMYDYDDRGRKTTVGFLPPGISDTGAFGWAIDGSEFAYGAQGAVKVTTRYDERDLPYEAFFQDADNTTLRRVTSTRDADGRVVREEAETTSAASFVANARESPGPARSEDDLAKMAALVDLVFRVQVTTYEYDDKGRLVERNQQSGRLAEERTRYRYDSRDNPVEEISESHTREIGVNDDGSLSARKELTRIHDVRFEYAYDNAGNWTERIVSARFEPEAPFQRTNVERRRLTYY